jgi:hypothetical protein
MEPLVGLLLIERDKLSVAIEALQGPATTEKTPGPDRKAVLPSVDQDSNPRATAGPTAPAKRRMSAAGRRAIIAGTKKRGRRSRRRRLRPRLRLQFQLLGRRPPKAVPAKAITSQERRSDRSRTNGIVHRHEETVRRRKRRPLRREKRFKSRRHFRDYLR